ncbi:hypothetical protein TeGR_g3029 [Tetraparma gracilis]|uniref:Uncharacterized protein n=1 Tax=Tetraparma gracilis TaxID=2962635 RepID=A0ABQ6N404_9STRA|nr:hypothetical protein TeGR_g3029 [Tetraparma gracilis]
MTRSTSLASTDDDASLPLFPPRAARSQSLPVPSSPSSLSTFTLTSIKRDASQGGTPYFCYVLLLSLAASFMAPWVSIGTLVSYYSRTPRFFTWMNVAFYLPGLPVSLLQFSLDERFDLSYGSRQVFLFRILVCLFSIIAICFLLPSASDSQTLILCSLLGVVTWSAHGTCIQLASLFSKMAVGFLQFGVQLPNLWALGLILALSLYGVTDASLYTPSKIKIFYFSQCLLVLAGVVFAILMWRRPFTKNAQRSYHRDIEASAVDAGAEDSMTASLLRSSSASNPPETRDSLVRSAISKHSFVLFFTIFASISSGSFFGQVTSTSSSFNIAQTLYFIRLFSDLGGRFVAASLPRALLLSSIDGLYKLTLLRLAVWVVFFAYIFPGAEFLLPRSDALICALTSFGSLHSGLCAVLVYEYAGTEIVVRRGMGKESNAVGARMLNIVFHKACFSASVVSLLLGLAFDSLT